MALLVVALFQGEADSGSCDPARLRWQATPQASGGEEMGAQAVPGQGAGQGLDLLQAEVNVLVGSYSLRGGAVICVK